LEKAVVPPRLPRYTVRLRVKMRTAGNSLMAQPRIDVRECGLAALFFALLIILAFPRVVFLGASLVASEQMNPMHNAYTVESKGPDFLPPEQWSKRGIGEVPNIHDPGSAWWQAEPGFHYFRRAIVAGQLPFWDPWTGAGTPASTNLTQSFWFPTQVLLSLAGATSLQKNIYILVLFWAAAFGTYCLLRTHDVMPIASAIGALLFQFSGAIQAVAPITFMAQAIVCLPYLLLVTRWFSDRPSGRRIGGLAITYAVASLASFPPILMPVFLITLVYFLFIVALAPAPQRRLLFVRYVSGGVLSVGLVAAYYVPTLFTLAMHDHATTHYRAAGLSYLPGRAFFGLLSPVATGTGIYLQPIAPPLGGGVAYVGVAALMLAVFAFGRVDQRLRPLTLACAALVLVIGLKLLGVRPVQWIGLLPMFRNIHYSHYAGMPLAFLLSALAGIGADRLLRKGVGGRLIALSSLLLAGALFALWRFAVNTGNLDQQEAWRWIADYRLLLLFAALAMAISAVCRLSSSSFMRTAAAGALLALVFTEGVVNATYPRQNRWDVFANPPGFVRFLAGLPHPARGFQAEVLRANLNSAFGIEQLGSLYTFFSNRIHTLYVTYTGSHERVFMRSASALPPELVLDRAGISWVTVNPHLSALVSSIAERGYPTIYEDDNGFRIFGRDSALRYYFTTEYQVADAARALQLIATTPASVLILEQQPAFPSTPNREDDPQPDVVSARLNTLELYFDAPRAGLLYVADVWDRGWSATVNGQDAEILVANYAFRAVHIPAGKVVVKMSYLPVGFVPGVIVSLLSTMVAAILIYRKEPSLNGNATV
jgi:hypothetical protein